MNKSEETPNKELIYEMAKALGNLINRFDYRTQTMYTFAKEDIDYARKILNKYKSLNQSMPKPLSTKTISEILDELEKDFSNDFRAMCENYCHTEMGMLTVIDAKLEHDNSYRFSVVQNTLLAGLNLLRIYFTTKNHYKYLGYIIDPKYTDNNRKDLLYPVFSEKSSVKITDEQDDWEVRARIILKTATGAHDGDIDFFVDEEWNNESSDMENLETFIFSLAYHASDLVEETESLENKQIHDGTNVFWKDPAGETSGYYRVDGEYEAVDSEEIDDRIIDITSLFGSQAQVYASELFIPKQ